MNDITATLVEDPELRFTNGGQPVANVRLAHTERRYDRPTGQWTDGATTYLRGTVWGAPAQNVAESLHKGDRVVVVGRLRQRDYETRDGEKRSTHELDIDEIGASLRYATADVRKATRNGTASSEDQPGDQPS